MPLDTYSDLKSEIASYLARSDVTAASTSVDTFIDLAESYINKKLRVRRMEKKTTLLTVGGEDEVLLPATFLELKALEYTGTPKVIEYVPLSSFNKMSTATSRAKYFTIVWDDVEEQDAIRLGLTPDGEYEMNAVYYSRIPSLSDENTTNWLLTDHPEIYLNGCLYYAFKRYRSPLAGEYKSLFEADIMLLNEEDEKMHTGGGGMKMRVAGTIV